jgi:hypothetical protein
MEEQIKCIKSSRMPNENQDSFTEGKIYVPFSYTKVVGYRTLLTVATTSFGTPNETQSRFATA